MQFVPSFLMATFFIQSCASLSCKMESHSFNVCRWKTEKKRSDKLQPFICKRSRIPRPSWRKHSEIHLKLLLKTTAKIYVQTFTLLLCWNNLKNIVTFFYERLQCLFCLFCTNFGLQREKQKYKSHMQGEKQHKH